MIMCQLYALMDFVRCRDISSQVSVMYLQHISTANTETVLVGSSNAEPFSLPGVPVTDGNAGLWVILLWLCFQIRVYQYNEVNKLNVLFTDSTEKEVRIRISKNNKCINTCFNGPALISVFFPPPIFSIMTMHTYSSIKKCIPHF